MPALPPARGVTCPRCSAAVDWLLEEGVCVFCVLVAEAQALGLYDIEENPLAD